MKKNGTAAAVLMLCGAMAGCSQNNGDEYSGKRQQAVKSGPVSSGNTNSALTTTPTDMPQWLELYKLKKVDGVSMKDNVIVVEFETAGGKNEVYDYYSRKYQNEENFSSSPDNHDMILFVREGYGAKFTLLDEPRNLWSLEYHKQPM